MPTIDISRFLSPEKLALRFRECTPKLLVVTDGNLNAGAGGFGLSRFVSVLQNTTIHGMLPIVTARSRGSNDSALDDLTISNFDVVFLFGWNGEGDQLSEVARNRIAKFMQSGGGLFATGDHEDMGSGLCGSLPRVRNMRFWSSAETPDIRDATRLTTSLSGVDDVYDFNDQGDAIPQRLYANFNIPNDYLVFAPWPPHAPTKVRSPHPLVRMSDGKALDVYPDHPHEGECHLPTDFGTQFEVDGKKVAEWPGGFLLFGSPSPRLVASTMSCGNGFDMGPTGAKDAVTPRSFGAICAYNGQAAGVGRVVTDATWHHYVNVNLNGMVVGGLPNNDLQKIQRYYSNLAVWLMPATTRKCLWPWVVFKTLLEHPIAEEIRIPIDGPIPPQELRSVGAAIVGALDVGPGSVGADLLADVVAATANLDSLAKVGNDKELALLPFERPASDLVLTLLGAAVVDLVRAGANDKLVDNHEQFAASLKGAGAVTRDALAKHRSELEQATRAASVLEEVFGD
jgi:hypothetical protein